MLAAATGGRLTLLNRRKDRRVKKPCRLSTPHDAVAIFACTPAPVAVQVQHRADKGHAMDRKQRERRHQANLDHIDRVQVLAGRGDRTRVDHEGTLFERARLLEDEIRSHRATELGLAAFDRLLRVAEERSSPHVGDVMRFLSAVWNAKPLPLLTLRGLEPQIGDDMVAVLDAFRYARLDLAADVQGGARRVVRVMERLGEAID
jgi:hypothetical protein